jgi:glycosyltransferase involved in cell wall biosynthesis
MGLDHNKKKMLLVGITPPPMNGMAMAASFIINSKKINNKYNIKLLDIADRRGLENVGKLDLWNIYLAINNAIRFFYYLIAFKPDIVYLPIAQNKLGFLRDSVFLIQAKILHRKTIVHLHGGCFDKFYKNSSLFFKKFIRFSLSKVEKAIVLSENLVHLFDGVVLQNKVVSIPNGIAPVKKKQKYNNKIGKIAYLGALDKRKGYIDLIRAVGILINDYPDIEVSFAGGLCSHSYFPEAQEEIRKNNLKNNVRFLGVLSGEEKFDFLRASDIFVFPSWNEGMPYVVLEAMGAGLPIITTNVGSLPTMITSCNGRLIDPRDYQQLAKTISFLISDPNLCRKMGEENVERARTKYSVDNYINDLDFLFGSCE